MRDQAKAYLYALATVFLWSTVASAFKLSLRYLDVIQLLFYAHIVSIGVLTLLLVFSGKIQLVFACRRRQYLASLALGLLNPLFYYLVLFKAYEILPAQVAQPLNYTWALTLTYLSIPLLGQKIGMKEAAAGVICYSGVLVITTGGDITGFRFSDPAGVGLALFSTVIWALYWIYSTKDNREPVVVLLLNFLFSLPFTAGLCFLFSDFRVTGIYGLLGAIYVGVFEMGITFVLWLTALKLSTNTARVGNLIFISPFLSLVFIHFLLGEAILPATFFGLALIVAGLFVQRLEMKS